MQDFWQWLATVDMSKPKPKWQQAVDEYADLHGLRRCEAHAIAHQLHRDFYSPMSESEQ